MNQVYMFSEHVHGVIFYWGGSALARPLTLLSLIKTFFSNDTTLLRAGADDKCGTPRAAVTAQVAIVLEQLARYFKGLFPVVSV